MMMKLEVFEDEICGGFCCGNIFLLLFFARKIVLRFVTKSSPHSSRGGSQQAKNLSPSAHSGSTLESFTKS